MRHLLAVCLLELLVVASRAEYVYEDGQWIWKDDAPPAETPKDYGDSEGSGDYYDNENDYYYEGSGDEYYDDYSDSRDSEESYNRNDWQTGINPEKTDNINYNWEPNNNNNNNNKMDYNKNNDEDIQLTDEVKSTAVVVTTTTIPTTVKQTTKPILIGNTNIHPTSFFAQPGILAAVVGGAVVGLLCAILLVMFIVYRMRKKDEGSYSLDEPRRSPAAANLYVKANSREFFA